jgi:catechol 2,3-dioxygenase-like lactoylglutathione lyase family enzyme
MSETGNLFHDLTTARMNRRDLMQGLALSAIAAALPKGTVTQLHGNTINHISYQSADYNKTRDFYIDLLGFQVSDEDEKQLYLWAGDMVISAKHAAPTTTPRMDHFGLGIDPYDLAEVKGALAERGLPATVNAADPHDQGGKTVFTRDPNRYSLQICAHDAETKPAPVSPHSPLKATAINHFSYQCADYKKTVAFYKELLDLPVSNDNGNQAYVWLGDAFILFRNAEGTMPLIDYYAWNVADWDVRKVTATLKDRGLEAQPDAVGKSVMTKDLNGYPMMLCSKDLHPKPQYR